MNVEKNESKIVAKFEGRRVVYKKEMWQELRNYVADGEVVELPEWKIDLVKNYGVDLNELRS